jgi:hypothetical protein
VWGELRSCVKSLHELVRTVDNRCCEIENDAELGPELIATRRTHIGVRALSELSRFKTFEAADKAANEKINALVQQSHRTPDEVQLYEKLTKARADLGVGLEATKRAVIERCNMRHA